MTDLTLRWEKSNLCRGLHEMLGAGELVDVTVACQGEFLQAHKTVLAACSPHFRALFTVNPCQHPIVIMQDIKLTHMQAMLNFMYQGEVTVNQDELPGFLRAAEALRVSGLAPNRPAQSEECETELRLSPPPASPPPLPKTPRNMREPADPAPVASSQGQQTTARQQTWLPSSEVVDDDEITMLLPSEIKVEAEELLEIIDQEDPISVSSPEMESDPIDVQPLPEASNKAQQQTQHQSKQRKQQPQQEQQQQQGAEWFEATPSTSRQVPEESSSQPSTSGVSSRGRHLKPVKRLQDETMQRNIQLPLFSRRIRSKKRASSLSVEAQSEFSLPKIKPEWRCSICLRNYTLKSSLSRHRKCVHGLDEAPKPAVKVESKAAVKCNVKSEKIICEVCKKAFTHNSQLKQHYKFHHPQKLQPSDYPYSCNLCNKNYINFRGLSKHIKSLEHGNKVKFPGKKTRAVKVKREMLQVTPTKKTKEIKSLEVKREILAAAAKLRHTCRFCPNTYAASSDRSRHEKRKHYDLLQFVCSVCGSRYQNQTSLKYHCIRWHK